MKKCEAGNFCKCQGISTKTKHYEVYSGNVESDCPDRFWGVVAYCEQAFEDEEVKGWHLLEVKEQRTYHCKST